MAESSDKWKSMPVKAHSEPRKRDRAASSTDRPVRLFVRRGALQRFKLLKERTANLDVEVSWDRRADERRNEEQPVSGDRRKTDRRRAPSFTWEMADFAVAVESEADKK